jgi:hypothetical protein
MSQTIIVILICTALAAFSLYREIRREAKRHLALRITATLLAIVTLACIILPVSYVGDTGLIGQRKLLLTAGFNKDSFHLTGTDSIYTLDRTIYNQYPKAKLLTNVGELAGPLHAFGYGFTKNEISELADKPITFHPSPIPDGIIAASWTDQIKAGEFLTVQLKIKSGAKSYKVRLNGLNTTLDSAFIQPNKETDITLQTKPRTLGKIAYSLLVMEDKDTLENEQLPVFISAPKPLNVFILSASPDFETKFLKNWLSENGYSVASRATITKGKFSQEYINTAQADLSHISAQLLDKFDVLVGDQSLLQSLNATESNVLQQAVSEKGMGIIIKADSAGKARSWLQRDFTVTHVLGKQPAATATYLQGQGKTAKLTIDPLYIDSRNNIQPLVSDEQQRILAATALAGSGKLIFTTISNSYNWLLGGNKNDYYALWSLLLSKAARKSHATANWIVQNSTSTINSPVMLTVENDGNINTVTTDHIAAYPANNPILLFKKEITYWPAKAGWHEVAVGKAVNYQWYTWDKDSWTSLTAAYKQKLTNQYASQHPDHSDTFKQTIYKSRKAVPKIYFFILFLMAATFLWAESKFFNA